MKQVEKTLVLSFTGGAVQNASGTVRAAWDDTRNRDADGEVKSQWLPGDSAYFFLQADASVRITRVAATSGAIVALGAAGRPQTDSLLFATAEHVNQLSWKPSGGVTPVWYGNAGSGLAVSGLSVTVASSHPCRGDLSYTAAVQTYRLDTPRVTLATGQTWPIDVVIYYQEVS